MHRSIFNECTALFVIIVFNLNIYANDQANENPATFSKDFEVFLRDLGTILDKSRNTAVGTARKSQQTQNVIPHKTTPETTPWINTKKFNHQKTVLNDVLMMKLVSYYEDKYRLAHHEQTTAAADHTVYTNPNFSNLAHIINGANQDIHKKSRTLMLEENFDNMFNVVDSATTTIDIAKINNEPPHVEEVLNLMDYVPSNLEVSRNYGQYHTPKEEKILNLNRDAPPTIGRVQSGGQYSGLNNEKVHEVMNFKIPNMARVKHISDYPEINVERVKNKIENKRSPNKRIQNAGSYSNPQIKRIPTIVKDLHPNDESIRSIMEDSRQNFDGVRIIVKERPRNTLSDQYILRNTLPEREKQRNFIPNRISNFDRESPYKRSNNFVESTLPYVDRVRTVIRAPPDYENAGNMRKNNFDNPISEVVVI